MPIWSTSVSAVSFRRSGYQYPRPITIRSGVRPRPGAAGGRDHAHGPRHTDLVSNVRRGRDGGRDSSLSHGDLGPGSRRGSGGGPSSTACAHIAAGGSNTCGVSTNGTLWCWGLNGTSPSEDLPTQVTTPAATGWATVTAGSLHTCATRADTSLWCWGDGFVGELGIGSATNEDTPQQVTTPAAAGWATVSPGENFTCAIRAGGTMWCWGFNGSGRLGIGSYGNKSLPQQVATSATTPWATVSAGGGHACATRTNRTLWCWGENQFGQLGLGNTTTETRPKQVTG
jgi:alpha-tubulin suppressor-like RCC1 family protein